jgi:hypothetical protein
MGEKMAFELKDVRYDCEADKDGAKADYIYFFKNGGKFLCAKYIND